MTNQVSELFELCKDVYKRLPEWRTGWWYPYLHMGEMETIDRHIYTDEFGAIVDYQRDVPLYTSDYLLKKLPVHIDEGVRAQHLLVYAETIYPYTENYYTALYEKSEYQEYSDTPLKALLKLTIALSEAGELGNE